MGCSIVKTEGKHCQEFDVAIGKTKICELRPSQKPNGNMEISCCYISFDEHFLWFHCAPLLLITKPPTSKIGFFVSTFCSLNFSCFCSSFATSPLHYLPFTPSNITCFFFFHICFVFHYFTGLVNSIIAADVSAFFWGLNLFLCIAPNPWKLPRGGNWPSLALSPHWAALAMHSTPLNYFVRSK